MKNKNIIVFDFDGVIADSTLAKLEVAIDIIKDMGVKINDINFEEAIKILRNDGYIKLLRKLNFPLLKAAKLVIEIKKRQFNSQSKIKPITGIQKVLRELSKECDLYILTGNSEEFITDFLHEFKIFKYFVRIFSDSQNKGKEKLFSKFKSDYAESISNGYYVGDEVLDIVNSQKIGLKCIAVTWGITSKEQLLKYKPYAIADKPADILKFGK